MCNNTKSYYLSLGIKFMKVLSLCLSKNRNEKCFLLECEKDERRAVQVIRMSRLWRSGLS